MRESKRRQHRSCFEILAPSVSADVGQECLSGCCRGSTIFARFSLLGLENLSARPVVTLPGPLPGWGRIIL